MRVSAGIGRSDFASQDVAPKFSAACRFQTRCRLVVACKIGLTTISRGICVKPHGMGSGFDRIRGAFLAWPKDFGSSTSFGLLLQKHERVIAPFFQFPPPSYGVRLVLVGLCVWCFEKIPVVLGAFVYSRVFSLSAISFKPRGIS